MFSKLRGKLNLDDVRINSKENRNKHQQPQQQPRNQQSQQQPRNQQPQQQQSQQNNFNTNNNAQELAVGVDSSHPNLAPRFHIKSDETVYSRLFLLHGTAGDQDSPADSSIRVHHHLDAFPSQCFPVVQNYFKALVHLQPGPNKITIAYEIPNTNLTANSTINIIYTPLLQNAPLHLVLILGKDSPGTFDSPDYKKNSEGNDLELAIKKLRLAGYMMSAFTAEQMTRNGFGHRTFRLEESWGIDTLSNQEKTQRSTAKVHIIRSEKTVDELRDPDLAQQNPNGKDTGGLYGIAADALSKHGDIFNNGEQQHVACLFLDAHWDAQNNLLLAHAALGGFCGNLHLAIFGGHSLWAWPSCIEEIVPCFMDTTPTDTSQVCNDANQSGTAWEALNIGQGAFQHEIGHVLSCPHQPSGVMLRDYVTWNRSFMPMDPQVCTRTGKPGLSLCLPKDECGWHRLDTMRFRYNKMFRMVDEPIVPSIKPQLYSIVDGVVAKCSSGIYMVEIDIEGAGVVGCIEYPETPTEIFLDRDELFKNIPEKNRDESKRFRIDVFGRGEEEDDISDFMAYNESNRFISPLGSGPAFKSKKLGGDEDPNTTVIFGDKGPISGVIVHSGLAVDGVEITFRNTSETCLFGKRGGSPKEMVFEGDENLIGFAVRSGGWVDAIQVITNKRRGLMCGNTDGGELHEIIPPSGFTPIGLYGSVQSWVDNIGMIYQAL